MNQQDVLRLPITTSRSTGSTMPARFSNVSPMRRNRRRASGPGCEWRPSITHQGAKTDAYRAVDALIAERPKESEAKLAKARLLLADGDAAQATQYAREALNINHDSAQAHYTIGLAALASNQLDDAESAFRQVIRINPRAAVAERQLAQVHLVKGEPEAALSASQRAVQLEPRDPAAVLLLVRSLRAAGNLSKARDELTKRLAQQPNSVAWQLELGAVALEGRDFPGARRAFDAALRNEPGLYDAQAGLVATEIAAGTLARARALVDGWLQQAPANGRLRLLLARVQLASGKGDEAERTLRDVVVSDPSQLKPTICSDACTWRKGILTVR